MQKYRIIYMLILNLTAAKKHTI